ncbi:DUF3631 domain-containing protein [Actinomycetospora sp. OC33-EN08]|uniref:DUF3631 domain-containing protein n=1 Tax=Actinomycetospora aurantiaca TaxID=3129233 RepID=A0ABU8MME4_9PSEU
MPSKKRTRPAEQVYPHWRQVLAEYERREAEEYERVSDEAAILREEGTSTDPTDGAALLDEVEAVYRRHVVLPSEWAYTAVALWVAATHAIEAWTFASRIVVTSPEKRCGKSRVLEVTHPLVARPFQTANATAAVLYRVAAIAPITILHDEMDTIFSKKNDAGAEDLRSFYNAGFERDQFTYRVAPNGDVKQYSTFSMAMFGAIGDLPDTIMDRSVVLRMRRREPHESVSPFRQRDAKRLRSLGKRIGEWTESVQHELSEPREDDTLSDREADVWESLLRIADVAGGEWPERARIAAKDMTETEATRVVEGKGVELLRDIAEVWPAGKSGVHSEKLQALLTGMRDTGWDTYAYGRPITVNEIASLLQPYEIKPRQIKMGGVNRRGYRREWFEPVWRRYSAGVADALPLPVAPENRPRPGR